MTSFLDALVPLVDAFETYNVDYYIGGSVATIAHGVPRTTLDVDVIAEIYPHQVHVLVKTLQHDFYIQATDIHDAIIQRSSFNIIHFTSMIKIDIFLAPNRAFDRSKAQRAHDIQLTTNNSRLFHITSCEDIVLQKLEWYMLGAQISERQWHDIQGVLKIQGTSLNFPHMRHWAAQLNISELLEQALLDAGLRDM